MDRDPESVAPNPEFLYWGADEPPEPARELRAGALSAILRGSQLSAICWREREVLHGIYVAVRDRNWGTVPVKLSNVHVRQESFAFNVAFDARHTKDDIDFQWHGGIEGD